MTKEEVLSLLLTAGEPVSGEHICRQLGVTRAAGWKAIDQLRQEGYTIEAESREVDYAVVGIGINCAHAELPPEVAAMSADLETATGKKPDRSRLAAELVRSLYEMEQALFTQKDAWLAEFSAHCVTIGQDVKLVRGDVVQFAHADGIDGEAALLVTYPDGTTGVIASGEVSVRGMYGYT